MKNNFILTILLLISGFVFSQTLEERNLIMKYYQKVNDDSIPFDFKKYPSNEKELAVEKAISLGIPTKIVDSKGNVGDLVRFDGDLPLYYTTYNEGAAITTRANLLHPGGVTGLNLTGAGMLVGVWDENHPRVSHSDFSGRLFITDGSLVNTSLHSTHVCGTIFSSGSNATSISGRGMAYAAEGWINDWSNDINEMNQNAGFGLLLSNHSYGLQAQSLPVWYFGAYVSDSNAVDNLCFNNPKYLPVYAAGNDRDSYLDYNPSKAGNDLLSGDKVSKNSLIVGAVYEVLNYLQSSDVLISNFSSYGPTDDFRIKPDVVSKGVDVYSTISSSDVSYGFLSGTSMASPTVAGSLLLVQEYFGDPFLNSATLKGLALHTADEAGDADGPDQKFGWGLLNVAKMVEVLQVDDTESIIDELVLNTGDVSTFNVMALGTEPLKASISWTDRPGVSVSGSAAADDVSSKLVNDLDIRITQLTSTYYPWKLNKDWSNIIALQEDNNVDPFERVDVTSPSGIYQVTVSHKGSLIGGSQNYSLVITGVDADAVLNNGSFVDDQNMVWFNKTNKDLNFDLSSEFLGGNITIFDCNGRMVKDKSIKHTHGSYNLDELQNGFYVINISTTNGRVISRKIVL